MSSTGAVGLGLAALANAAQAGAYAIQPSQAFSQFTSVVAGATNSCILPANQPAGTMFTIRNDSATAATLNIYPPVGGQIDTAGANVVKTLLAGGTVSIVSGGSNLYYSVVNQSVGSGFAVPPILTHNGAGPFNLTAGQSGSIVSVTQQAGAVVCNLPAASAGLNYKFILDNNAAGSYTITSAGAAGTMKGQLNSSNGVNAVLVSTNGFNRANAIKAVFLAAGVQGDWISVSCGDGTNWVANGQSGATDGNVFNT